MRAPELVAEQDLRELAGEAPNVAPQLLERLQAGRVLRQAYDLRQVHGLRLALLQDLHRADPRPLFLLRRIFALQVARCYVRRLHRADYHAEKSGQ